MNLKHFGRTQRIGYIFLHIIRISNDIDLLSAKLIHDSLNTSTLGTNTRAYRINLAVAGMYSNFRTKTSFTSDRTNLYYPVEDFRNFQFKEPFQKARMSTGEQNLRSFRRVLYLSDIGFDPITVLEPLIRH
ncbi:hypothetical protein D3C73_1087690 [compost metagenome]